MKSSEQWSNPLDNENRDNIWGSQGNNLRAPIIPIPLGEHLISLGDEPLEQARLLYFYAVARNSDVMGVVAECLATFDLPLLLGFWEQYRASSYIDGVEYLTATLESKEIPGEIRGQISAILDEAQRLRSAPANDNGDSFFDPYRSVVDEAIVPPILYSAESEWPKVLSSQACATILSIAMFQSHLRHMEGKSRGGFSPEALDGACTPGEEEALEMLAMKLWEGYTDSGDHDNGFTRSIEQERVFGAILSPLGASLIDLLPLALLAEEYNWEWAMAAFDWDSIGDGERIPLPFMEK